MGSREGIDLLGALGAADVCLDHRPFDRLGRPAFVPEEDGKVQRSEVASECAHRLRAGRIASVHVKWKSKDKARDPLAFNEFSKQGEVRHELGSTNGFRGSRE